VKRDNRKAAFSFNVSDTLLFFDEVSSSTLAINYHVPTIFCSVLVFLELLDCFGFKSWWMNRHVVREGYFVHLETS
jgi:hypothetical protein